MIKWSLNDIYCNYSDFEKAYQKLKKTIDILEDKLLEDKFDVTRIDEKINEVEEVYEVLSKIYNYILLLHNNNLNNDEYKQQLSKCSIMYTTFEKYVDSLQEKIDGLCEDAEIDDVRWKTQLVSELRDNLFINDMFEETIYQDSYINEFIYQNKKYVINSVTHIPLLCDSSPDIRRLTYMHALEKFEKFKDTIAFVLNAHYKLWDLEAFNSGEKNGFEYILMNQGMLDDYITIKKILNENMHVHYQIIQQKKKLLGLNSMSFYDMYPLGIEDNKFYDIKCAKSIMLKVFEGFGEEYVSVVKKAFNENWIDWEPSRGKTSEVYSVCVYNVHPYICLNWNGTLECLYNLAHELGGAIASYMGMSKQTVFEFEPSRLINEIAAFVNEKLLTDYLLHSSSNEREKKVIMLKSLERMRENLFQCLESAEMEECLSETIKDKRLTSECISDIYMKIIRKHYSTEGFSIIQENRHNWVKNRLLIGEGYSVEYMKSEILAEEIFNQIKKQKITCELFIEALKFGTSKSNEEIIEFLGCETDINVLLNKQVSTIQDLIMSINKEQE